jgi:hypothetical protein
VLVLALLAAVFLAQARLAPAHRVPVPRVPELHAQAHRVLVDQVRVLVPAALASAQAAQVVVAVRAQQVLVAVDAQAAHPEATLVPTVRQVAVAVAAPVVEPRVLSAAVAARARHASRSARSGQSLS